jgi:hypothetical protein
MVEVNSGLLSDCSDVGRPNGMISLKSMVSTMEAVLLIVWKASIYLLECQ